MMLKNYFKIALRNLLRYRTYSLINIIGLAMGMAICILILLYIQHELGYDRYHQNSDAIYRLVHERDLNGTYEKIPRMPLAAKTILTSDFPEIKYAVRFLREFDPVIQYGDKQFVEERFFFTDPEVFEVFSFELLQGNPKTALEGSNHIVITETAAAKYFGDENPLGKILTYRKWGQQFDFAVTGVVKDLPDNSHFKFDFLAKMESDQNLWNAMHGQDWYYVGSWTYLLIPDPQAAANLTEKLPGFVQRHFPSELQNATTLTLQPLTDIHLHSHLDQEIEANGNINIIYVLAAIVFAVLLIACINFMNLATARSATRAKEVGMRKVVGAFRSDLIRQFIGETLLTSFTAGIITIGLVELLLPLFNNLVNQTLFIRYFENPVILPALIAIAVIVGILAGSYPAFYLSAFRPVQVLKGDLTAGSGGGSLLRKILVVCQFAVSIALLIAIGIISRQVDFMRNKDLGFNKSEVAFIKTQPGVNFHELKTRLRQGPGILEVIGGGSVPVSENARPITWQLFRPIEKDENVRLQMPSTVIDYDYAKTFGLELMEGRFFSEEFTTDASDAVLINETAAREFGWTDNAIGKEIEVYNMMGASSGTRRVIGVVRDFHFESLHQKIKPIVLYASASGFSNFILRINSENLAGTISFIEKEWKAATSDFPLQLYFLNDDLNTLYQQDQRLNLIIHYLTFLAIFICCLGLFGLAAFSAEKRTKEIGVRKVLGASVLNIILLLSKEFAKLVGIAFIVAVPLSYLIMNRWLQDFAYRITIGWEIFALAGGLALLIALLTVSFQAVKAAVANPVDSLRYE